jgi:alkanesulfonate monooxygenase SsuD/methylene tetrahydromethanopterin reductase-like flavin-dependent oxidoreductase (luciferase family)
MERERLGLATVPVGLAGWGVADIQAIAREAEAAGFEAIFTTEVNNDAMATAQLMGTATERIKVGTWIANIYLRHPYVCAQGAAFIAALTGGRFILGLGVSHQPVNGALKIDMSNAAQEFGSTQRRFRPGSVVTVRQRTCRSSQRIRRCRYISPRLRPVWSSKRPS